MVRAQSSVSVGKGDGGSGAGALAKSPGGAQAGGRGRAIVKAGGKKSAGVGSSLGWGFYSEDASGFKVTPVPVLVFSLAFIATVFLLHIWGKLSRG